MTESSRPPRPKKSEMLEVRLSYEDKQALQSKAAREGRSVSAVVRGLISDYLGAAQPTTLSSSIRELIMTLKSKPKSVLATLAGLPLLAMPFLLPATANAEDIALMLESEYTQPAFENGIEGKRVRRSKTEIEIGDGHIVLIPVAAGLYSNPDVNLHMTVQVIQEPNDIVSLAITLCETDRPMTLDMASVELVDINPCKADNIYSQPKIKAKFGETAEFRMGDEGGEMFSFKASPRKL